MASDLGDVQALLFDVFGTVSDWHGTVTRELEEWARKKGAPTDINWESFTEEWREGYYAATKRIAKTGEGSTNIDVIHRQLLEDLLATEKWSHVAHLWSPSERDELNHVWHRLDGWSDSSQGLAQLRKRYIITTLSNGSVRLLVDMAKHANLPWDTVFCGELLGSYKPNPIMYTRSAKLLGLPTHRCALVAAHASDLRAAASNGLRTIYVRRPTEDKEEQRNARSKSEGGEFDLVVDSFIELAERLRAVKP